MVNFNVENLALSLPALIYIASLAILLFDLAIKEIDFGWVTVICGIVAVAGAVGFVVLIIKQIAG